MQYHLLYFLLRLPYERDEEMKINKIEVSFVCGTDIAEAAKNAYFLAAEKKSEVNFKFNGFVVSIKPYVEEQERIER